MTTHSTYESPFVRVSGAALALLGALALSACGSGADDDAQPAASDVAGDATDAVVSDPAEEPAGEPAEEPAGGVVRVDGVEYPDFEGECEISRDFGREDVGSLAEPGLSVVAAMDNTEAHPDAQMLFTVIGEESFSFRDLEGRPGTVGVVDAGTLDSITEMGERTADGSREVVVVRFAGTLDEDGVAVEADVVCELQNTF